MSEIAKKFGKRVRELRKERNITQELLAELAELHRTYIGQIERGEKNISIKNIEKIAQVLEVDIESLFDFEK